MHDAKSCLLLCVDVPHKIKVIVEMHKTTSAYIYVKRTSSGRVNYDSCLTKSGSSVMLFVVQKNLIGKVWEVGWVSVDSVSDHE